MNAIDYYSNLLHDPVKLDLALDGRQKKIKRVKYFFAIMSTLATIVMVGDIVLREPVNYHLYIPAGMLGFSLLGFHVDYQLLSLLKAIQSKYEEQVH